MDVLFVSDIVGGPGRKALRQHLPGLRENFGPALVVVNGENAAGGFGITPEVAKELFGMGVDVITTGNHVWDKKEVMEYLDEEPRLIRPANYPPGVPGYGWATVETEEGVKVGVVNLMGRIFMPATDCPFRRADDIIRQLKDDGAEVIIVDFHAEATSEKIALGRYLDGRVAAVIGTHTHVQTADERLFPGGTAYISDAGMTGPTESVIGVSIEKAVGRFLTQTPARFDTAKGPAALQAVVVTIEPATGLATAIKRVSLASG